MTVRFLPTFALAVLSLISCVSMQQQKPKSRVIYFHYGGYGDTVYATLAGAIFQLDTSLNARDSMVPLPGVKIENLEHNTAILSDFNGQFVINLERGIFSFLLTKKGFQPLLLKNYIADPDQHAGVKIYMEKGTTKQTYIIPSDGKE